APLLVGLPNHRHVPHASVTGQHVLDLDRMDVLATADDHVVDAPGDPEVALRVDPAHVAREVPTLAQRPRVGVGAVPVPGERFVRLEARDDLTFDPGARDLVWPDAPLGAGDDDPQRRVDPRPARAAGLGAHVGMD